MKKYFGTDGIRGKAFEKLNSELAYKLGQGISYVFKPDTVVIGMDTRASSPMLAYSIANGLQAKGVNVLFAGVVSTPMIAYYSLVKNMIGIMITASHNPYTDNGIKIFKNGYKTYEEDELKIEAFIDHGQLTFGSFGRLILSDDIEKEYLKIYKQFNDFKSNLKVIADAANGANHLIADKLLNHYTNDLALINIDPDGYNINHHCGSTYLNDLPDMVKDNFDIGFSYDGDGDRIIMIDHLGNIFDGDLIIYTIAKYLKLKGELKHNKVVLTKMSNPAILKALRDLGIDYTLTDVGDKYVFKALDEENLNVGGESSGHIILNHLLHSGDGLLVSIYILYILNELKMSLHDFGFIKPYPIKTHNIKNISKSVLLKPEVLNIISEHQNEIEALGGILLVRASGTEDLIRVTLSVEDENTLNDVLTHIVRTLEKEGMKS